MVFFGAAYNFKLACLFLDELRNGFQEVSQSHNIKEIKSKYGGTGVDLRSRLETIESNDSYCFQTFGI